MHFTGVQGFVTLIFNTELSEERFVMNALWRDRSKAMLHFRLRLPTPDGVDVELRQFT